MDEDEKGAFASASPLAASALVPLFVGGGVCGFDPSTDDPCEAEWGGDGAGECAALEVVLAGADIDERAVLMSPAPLGGNWGELEDGF